MGRSKKSRKPGALGAPEPMVTRNRSESDVEGRERKRVKSVKALSLAAVIQMVAKQNSVKLHKLATLV